MGRHKKPTPPDSAPPVEPSASLIPITKVSPLTNSVLSQSQSIDFYAESCGREEFVKAMRLCYKVTPIMELLALYDRLSETEKEQVSFDVLCGHINFDPEELVVEVTRALFKARSRLLSITLSNSAHQALLAGTEAAKDKEGVADRKMIYQMAQMMPFDKANEININQNFGGYTGVPRFEDSADAKQDFVPGSATRVDE